MKKFFIFIATISLGLYGTPAHARATNRNSKTRNFDTTMRLINLSKEPRRVAELLSQLSDKERIKAFEQAQIVEALRKADFDEAYANCPVEELKNSRGDQLLYGAAVTTSIYSSMIALGSTFLFLHVPLVEVFLPPILIGIAAFGISTELLRQSRKKRATRAAYARYQNARDITSLFATTDLISI